MRHHSFERLMRALLATWRTILLCNIDIFASENFLSAFVIPNSIRLAPSVTESAQLIR